MAGRDDGTPMACTRPNRSRRHALRLNVAYQHVTLSGRGLAIALVLGVLLGSGVTPFAGVSVGNASAASIAAVSLQDDTGDTPEDLDCIDFEFQEEAQAVLDERPGDPNNLDPNGDGIACALLPTESGEPVQLTPIDEDEALDGAADDTASESSNRANDEFDCVDFDFQEEAQEVLDERPRDPNGLDPDGDGIACEELPSESGGGGGNDSGGNNSGGGGNRNGGGGGANQNQDSGCSEFDFQEAAQKQLDRRPRDPNNLDPDGNGIACEELPSESGGGGGGGGNQGQDSGCDAFDFQEEAQDELDEQPRDPNNLDPDGNGIACEELPSEFDDTRRDRDRRDSNREITQDIDCIDFEFQEEAQEVYDEDRTDPYNLDPNGDGFACSSLPSESGDRPVITIVPRTGSGEAEVSPPTPAVGVSLGLISLLVAGASVVAFTASRAARIGMAPTRQQPR